MAYKNSVNITLATLQRALAADLRRCSRSGKLPDNVTLQYVVGRGDWKYKAEWLQEKKTYANLKRKSGPGFCRRCNCTSSLRERHWLNATNLSFNEPRAVSETLHSNIPLDLPLRRLIPGYHADMEQSDVLRNLWLGSAKDAVGSILCDIVQYHPELAECTSWEDGLNAVCALFHDFCFRHNLDKSAIDEMSFLDLCRRFFRLGIYIYTCKRRIRQVVLL